MQKNIPFIEKLQCNSKAQNCIIFVLRTSHFTFKKLLACNNSINHLFHHYKYKSSLATFMVLCCQASRYKHIEYAHNY
jgi:hypothetical protein